MSPTTALDPATLSPLDTAVAEAAARALSDVLARPRSAPALVTIVADGEPGQRIDVPTPAFELLVAILTELAKGNGVTVMPVQAELTTQEAANLLNVSRPYLVKLLEEGQLPFRKVGSRRRVLLVDLLAYKARDNAGRDRALAQLAPQAQVESFGYSLD